jgi:hypothetical protein
VVGGADPTFGEGLALGLGLGEAAPGDGLGVGRPVRLGTGLVRRGCGWTLGLGLATTPGVGGGVSVPPGTVTEDTGRTSR